MNPPSKADMPLRSPAIVQPKSPAINAASSCANNTHRTTTKNRLAAIQFTGANCAESYQ
jgi:hypothetical protein